MRVGAGVRETKILRIPSRRAQRALVRVAPAARKLDLREQRRGPRAAARRGQRRGGGGEGEGAMNDRNQRNTAPRKLPGIRPAYIIRTGVPAGGGVHSGREVGAVEAPRGREACPRWIAKGSRGFLSVFALAGTTPNYGATRSRPRQSAEFASRFARLFINRRG